MLDVLFRHAALKVKIAQLDDSQAGGTGHAGDGDLEMIDLQPGRFHEHGVAEVRQRPADPAGQTKASLIPRPRAVEEPSQVGKHRCSAARVRIAVEGL
jgi:hypothetical protein